MEGAKKADDKLNMVGVVVVGICGAVLVYVSIVLLEAFYMDDTAEVNTMADYGGQDMDVKSIKASQMANISAYAKNTVQAGAPATYRISIDHAMEMVVQDGKNDASMMVPMVGKAEKATIQPAFGRPQPLGANAPAPAPTPEPTPAPAPTPTTPADGAGSGSGSGTGTGTGTGTGSAAPAPATAPAPAPATAPVPPGGSGH
jgi:hypothetical protein